MTVASEEEVRKADPVEKESQEEKLERWKQDIVKDAEDLDEQRFQANQDMRIADVPGAIWEGFLEDQFGKRAKLDFDIITNHLHRFIGEWNQNRVGVEYKPDDDATSDDDANLLNGIYRADFRHGGGKLATDNMVAEIAKCGAGGFKLATIFEDPEDPQNHNQRVVWRPKNNVFWMYIWDRASKDMLKRDARWCTELEPFTRDSFEEAYPDKIVSSAYNPDTQEHEDINSKSKELIYVASRYEIVRKKEDFFVFNNLQEGVQEQYNKEDYELIADELSKDPNRRFVRVKTLITQHVQKTVFSGAEILQKTRRIPGKYIPIIIGYGYWGWVDGREYWRGLVRKLIDPARTFNMQVSQVAENAASTGQEKPIFAPEQIVGNMKNLWKNVNNKPYLLANPLKDKDGNIISMGPIGSLKPAVLDQNTQALMQVTMDYVREVTGGAPQETTDPDASGKAIVALQKRENMNTQVLNDHIAAAIEWSGVVYAEIASDIYDSERMVRTIGKDGSESKEFLLKHVLDPKTGTIVRANTIRGKRFRAFADTGPQYQTMKEATVENMKGIIEMLVKTQIGQQYLPPALAVLFANVDGAGMDPIREVNRKIMLAQGFVKPQTDEEKQFVAKVQQPQKDPQAELIAAAAEQAKSEARNLDSASIEKLASADLKAAQAAKTKAEIPQGRAKTLVEIRNMALKQAEQLPFGPS